MARSRTVPEVAAGKLVSAIQKVWAECTGTEEGKEAELVMKRAEDLLWGIRRGNLESILANASARAFVGDRWIAQHISLEAAMKELEAALRESRFVSSE